MVKGTIPHRVEYRQAAHLRFQATEPVGAYIPESMSGADPGGGRSSPRRLLSKKSRRQADQK